MYTDYKVDYEPGNDSDEPNTSHRTQTKRQGEKITVATGVAHLDSLSIILSPSEPISERSPTYSNKILNNAWKNRSENYGYKQLMTAVVIY